MKKQDREVLNSIIEQIRDMVTVSDEIKAYLENSEAGRKIGMIRTEISQLLEGEASMEWFELVDAACQKEEDMNMWTYEIVRAFKGKIPCRIVKEAMEEAEDIRRFQELVERRYAAVLAEDSKENLSCQDSVTEQQSDTAAGDDLAAAAINIVEDHMDRQALLPLGDTGCADRLIALAVDARDTLKEYSGRIGSLENMVRSQKQLMDSQMQTIKQQERTIAGQKAAIGRYEKQLEQVSRQYSDMNQTLLRLNSIQTELRMIGEED